MKAMDKDRNRRYSTAGTMADDVFVSSATARRGRPPSAWYRFSKFRAQQGRHFNSLVRCLCVDPGNRRQCLASTVAITERDKKEIALQKARAAEHEANEARANLNDSTIG